MRIGSTYIRTSGPDPMFLFGVRFLKSGNAVFEIPVMAWQVPGLEGLWMQIGGPGAATDVDRVVARVQDLDYPLGIRVDPYTAGEASFEQQVPATPGGPPITEYGYDLPGSNPTPPPGGGEPPASPVLLGGLSLNTTQVEAGGKVRIGVQIHVSSTFQGKINVSLLANPPVGPVSTGLRDFLAGSYSMPLDMTIPVDTPPGTYPLYTEILDAGNNRLVYFTTEPILTVLPAPPSPPPAPGVVINALAVAPAQARPGDKLSVAAQVTVSAAFKGLMSFALFGNTTTIGVKDWALGSYPVAMEVTVPQDTQPGVYQGIWLAVDTVAEKQLASRDVQVEVLGESPPVSPPPDAVNPGWLTPLIDLAAVGVVFGGIKGLNKLVQKGR